MSRYFDCEAILSAAAEHVVPADRFAHKIVRFLTVVLGALAAAEL
jgi:hypothetical protein